MTENKRLTAVAVICEYNPFHNGHKLQIDEIRQRIPNAYIIALMSGCFVQRGAPAVFHKAPRSFGIGSFVFISLLVNNNYVFFDGCHPLCCILR